MKRLLKVERFIFYVSALKMKVSGKQKELADLLASFPAVKHLERCLRLHLCLLPHIPDHTVNHWEKTLQPITNCPQHFLWPWLGGGEGVWKDCHIFWWQFSPSHQGKAVISCLLFSLSVQHIQFKATIATHSLSIHVPDVLLIQEHQENELNFLDITIGVHPTYIWLFRISCFSLVSMFRRSLKDG